jgi:phosphatidylserine/phosphatidylglycerophosphate/cardiolipin synthase-like enzyme
LIRIVADWSQGAPRSAAMLEAMRREGLANLYLKVKLDMPYRWDAGAGRMRYSYGASRGMLHHKTLCLTVDGRPRLLVLGSYNWSARGRLAYENLLVLPASDELAPVMAAFVAEFEALWSDHRLTAAPGRAQAVAARLRAEAAAGRDLTDPGLLADVFGLAGDALPVTRAARTLSEGRCLAAFSGRPLIAGPEPTGGHSAANDRRSLNLLRPSGVRRPAPLTLNTLALEAIRSVPDGGRLAVAMYALSPRVPEFGALIAAARRGVRVQVLLDGRIGPQAAHALQGFATREGLPLSWRLTGRRMHQKYLCSPDVQIAKTGAACP